MGKDVAVLGQLPWPSCPLLTRGFLGLPHPCHNNSVGVRLPSAKSKKSRGRDGWQPWCGREGTLELANMCLVGERMSCFPHLPCGGYWAESALPIWAYNQLLNPV